MTQPLPPVPQEVLDGIKFDEPASEVTPQPNPVPDTPAQEPVATPPATPVPEPTNASPAVETPKEPTLPARYGGESDTQYDLRTKLFIAGQAKAGTEDPAEKSLISKEMKKIREDLAKANQVTPPSPTSQPSEDERASAIKTLNELGFKTEDQVLEAARRLIQEETLSQQASSRRQEQDTAISEFYKHRDDIFVDDAKRTSLENYVLQMFGPQLPNMGKQQMLQTLDMAASYLYPRSDINKKIEQANTKIAALDIHGNQGGDPTTPTVDSNTKQKLVDMGWSEKDLASFEKK